MDEELKKYRSFLIATEQKAQESFDKTVLSLSSGALGISFAFVKDIVGNKPFESFGFLLGSWVVWGISVACVLFSFSMSRRAFRRAIDKVDAEEAYNEPDIGGIYNCLTEVLNILSGLSFLLRFA